MDSVCVCLTSDLYPERCSYILVYASTTPSSTTFASNELYICTFFFYLLRDILFESAFDASKKCKKQKIKIELKTNALFLHSRDRHRV